MPIPTPLVLGVAAAAALAALAVKPSKASAAAQLPGEPKRPKPPPKPTPDELKKPTPPVEKIVATVASGDPEAMRELAEVLRSAGWTDQANDLDKAAMVREEQIQQARAARQEAERRAAEAERKAAEAAAAAAAAKGNTGAGGLVTSPGQPTATKPPTLPTTTPKPAPAPTRHAPPPPPPEPPPEFAPDTSTPKGLAAAVVRDIDANGRNFDPDLLALYKAQEGLKQSQYYGPGTAKSLWKYGFVSPTPIHWPTRQTAAAKKKYKEELLYKARQDPSRAAEWTAAAQAVR